MIRKIAIARIFIAIYILPLETVVYLYELVERDEQEV